ncbi:MAG: helix-turn-helix domain-containing protein [Sphingomonas sp.]
MADELKNHLRELRAERDLTQAALAEAVGVSRKTIQYRRERRVRALHHAGAQAGCGARLPGGGRLFI